MKPSELLSNLKRNGLASLYLIFGEEDYLRDEAINTIRSWKKLSETGVGAGNVEEIFSSDDEFFYDLLYGDETVAQVILSRVQ